MVLRGSLTLRHSWEISDGGATHKQKQVIQSQEDVKLPNLHCIFLTYLPKAEKMMFL